MGTSLWHLTEPEIETDDPTALSSAFNVVVVGAGLTGLVSAVLLARAGLKVAVVDARRVGALTTGNTTGKLSLLQGTVFSEIRSHSGDEVLRAYAEANREGQAWLLRELESWGIDVERRPAFTYVPSEPNNGGTDDAALERERDAAQLAGIPVAETRATELPFPIAGALTLEHQAQLQPMTALAALAREFREREGVIIEQCRVRDVHDHKEGIIVISDRGAIAAEQCVIATGMPILDRGLFFAKLDPSRSYAAAYRLLSGAAPRGMYLSVGSPTRSLRTGTAPDGSELLVVGGGTHVTGRSDDTAAAIREMDEWTGANFGAVERFTWWGAQDYRTHWRLPFAGKLPRGGDRIYAATGYNKWGMTNAVASGLTIAADILGGNLEWAKTLREHALRLPAVMDGVGVNAEVGRRLVVDWTSVEVSSEDPDRAESELAEGEGMVVRDGAAPVGISRVGGMVCRVSAVCPHLRGILNWNSAEQSWDCPLHASRFSAQGERLEGPAVEDLKVLSAGSAETGAVPEPGA